MQFRYTDALGNIIIFDFYDKKNVSYREFLMDVENIDGFKYIENISFSREYIDWQPHHIDNGKFAIPKGARDYCLKIIRQSYFGD
jgi:hypothetical protein